jgi:hypothetical protein
VDPQRENLRTSMEALRAELDIAMSDSDGLDQKALLIPSFAVALAAFFLSPTVIHPGAPQIVLILAAVGLGAATVIAGFATLRPTATHLGPETGQLVEGLTLDPVDFDRHVVGSLVQAVDLQTASNITKSETLWVAMRLAIATVMCVVAARLLGGS